MATDDPPPEDWQELDPSKRKAIVEMAEQPGVIDRKGNFIDLRSLVNQFGLSRRQGLQALGLVAGGATLGNAIMQSVGVVSAAASESDSDGDVGQTSSRVDVFADGVDANSVSTVEGEVTGETSIELVRNSDNTGISSNTWTNAFDGSNRDQRGEVSSAQFTPDKDGLYRITANIGLAPGSDQDIIRARLRNTTDGTDLSPLGRNWGRENASGSGGIQTIQPSQVFDLTAGKTYEIQVQDFDSSFDILADGTAATITRSVVQ